MPKEEEHGPTIIGGSRWSGFDDSQGWPSDERQPAGQVQQARHTVIRPAGPEIAYVAWLYCQKGPEKGSLFQLMKQRNEIGHAPDQEIPLRDEYASAHHGAVVLDGETWKLFDFASTNGTSVSGKQLGKDIAGPYELNDNDVITIGDTELVFKKIDPKKIDPKKIDPKKIDPKKTEPKE